MRPLIRSYLTVPLLLAASGLAVMACQPTPDDGFSRGGGDDGHGDPGHDDDDDGHGGDEDRWAYWDLVRTTGFGSGVVGITATASFFEQGEVRAWPQPGGLDDCLVGSADADPHRAPESITSRGNPVMLLDGEEWELDIPPGSDVYTRALPERTWVPFDEVTLAVPGAKEPAMSWDGALSIPETLEGVSASLSADGLELEWEAGAAENQLRLIISSTTSGRFEYIVCLPNDDGAFTVPVDDVLDGFEGWDVAVQLRRETLRDDFWLDNIRRGTVIGISALRAEFSIVSGFWTDGDDDDSSR